MKYYDHIPSSSPLDRLIASAKRRPEALLLFAAGVALFMSKDKIAKLDTQDLRRKAHDAQDYVSDVASRAYDRASSMVEPARDYAQRVGSYVSDAGSSAASQASGYAQQAGDYAQQARQSAQSNLEHYVRQQPIALGIAALAAGAAIGAALPETDVENRTLGTPRDMLARKAQDLAEGQIQHLKEAAGEFGEKVAAQSHGDSERSST